MHHSPVEPPPLPLLTTPAMVPGATSRLPVRARRCLCPPCLRRLRHHLDRRLPPLAAVEAAAVEAAAAAAAAEAEAAEAEAAEGGGGGGGGGRG